MSKNIGLFIENELITLEILWRDIETNKLNKNDNTVDDNLITDNKS